MSLGIDTSNLAAFGYSSISVWNSTVGKSPLACWFGPQGSFGVCELDSFQRQLNQKLCSGGIPDVLKDYDLVFQNCVILLRIVLQ